MIPHSLIIHITGGDYYEYYDELRDQLHKNEDFKKYYDGWEASMKIDELLSYRLYYYKIPKSKLSSMLKFLYSEGKEYEYRIHISDKNEGNYNFNT
jgi:hypothetical protein